MASINDLQFKKLSKNQSEITLLESAARTTSVNSVDFTNVFFKGGHFVVDVTSTSLTPSITVSIQGKDELSGKYYDILVSAAITTVGTTVLRVYPGISSTANLSASDVLPKKYRVKVTHADADSITYSVGASLVN